MYVGFIWKGHTVPQWVFKLNSAPATARLWHLERQIVMLKVKSGVHPACLEVPVPVVVVVGVY
jgi:hypothetical protein